MKFPPKTDEQLKTEAGHIEPGEYDFTIDAAAAKISKKAQAAGATEPNMIELQLTVFTPGGDKRIRDWVMESMGFKLKHFAYAIGCGQAYENGGLEPGEIVGRSGKVKIRMGKATEKFPARAEVSDYIVVGNETVKAAANAAPKLPAASAGADEPPF